MSDLLQRLALRSQGAGSPLRPRMGSVFEPRTDTWAVEAREPPVEFSGDGSEPVLGADRPRAVRAERVALPTRRPEVARAEAEGSPPLPEATRPPEHADSTEERVRATSTELAEPAESEVTALVETDERPERPVLDVPSAQPGTAPPGVEPSRPPGRTAAAPRETRTPAPPPATEARLAPPLPAADRPTTVPVPPAVRPRARAPSVSAEPNAEAERVVHVTIGRVEVKAASATSAAPDEPVASPAVSLGDYLRRASGGSA